MEDERMRYLLIVCDDPAELERMSDAERARIPADYRAFTQSLGKAGHFRAGDALEPVSMATTVRLRHDRRLITDGPFAETREHLVGYYLVEARDLDEAIGIAARIPAARFGAVEVRPVMRLAP
jgi:hypothetical protein